MRKGMAARESWRSKPAAHDEEPYCHDSTIQARDTQAPMTATAQPTMTTSAATAAGIVHQAEGRSDDIIPPTRYL